jgi:hypothetical protein
MGTQRSGIVCTELLDCVGIRLPLHVQPQHRFGESAGRQRGMHRIATRQCAAVMRIVTRGTQWRGRFSRGLRTTWNPARRKRGSVPK